MPFRSLSGERRLFLKTAAAAKGVLPLYGCSTSLRRTACRTASAVPRRSNSCASGTARSCSISCGLREPFHSLTDSSARTSIIVPPGRRSASSPLPKATASIVCRPCCRTSFRCLPSCPILRVSFTAAPRTMNLGSGLDMPKGASRSSSSAACSVKSAIDISPSAAVTGIRCSGVSTAAAYSFRAAAKASRLSRCRLIPAAAGWPP
ncbi:hypothetical protein D3C80_1484280 [compost metagenome]